MVAEPIAAWDHATHGPHTLLSHDDKRYAGCRGDECEPLYRDEATGHSRYDSDEFDYSGCVKCDTNGDTLGWPCPTIRERIEEARARTQVPGYVEWTPIHEAVAHAVCCGPDGQDWLEARVFAVQVLEALRDEGHDVVPIAKCIFCGGTKVGCAHYWPEPT